MATDGAERTPREKADLMRQGGSDSTSPNHDSGDFAGEVPDLDLMLPGPKAKAPDVKPVAPQSDRTQPPEVDRLPSLGRSLPTDDWGDDGAVAPLELATDLPSKLPTSGPKSTPHDSLELSPVGNRSEPVSGPGKPADDWAELPASASLELAPSAEFSIADRIASTRATHSVAPGNDESAVRSQRPPVDSAKSSEARPPLEVDAYEVKALADYGDDPDSFLRTIPYAIRVVRRRRALARGLAIIRAALIDAEKRRLDRLAEFGAVLRPFVEQRSAYAPLLAPLSNAESSRQTREAGLQEVGETYRAQLAAIDAEVATKAAPLAHAAEELRVCQGHFEDADRLRQKHEARRKRVEIDVRSARTIAAQQLAPTEDRRRAEALIAAADAEREQRAAEERLAIGAATDAEGHVARARQHVRDIERDIEGLQAKRADAEREFVRQGRVRMEGIEVASREVRGALVEIAKRAQGEKLLDSETIPGGDVKLRAVSEADISVKKLQRDLETHLRAIAAAHERSVKTGLIALGSIIVVLLLSFVLWRVLRTNPYMENQPKKTQS